MGREPENEAVFIHSLKIRLTTISGYAQLLERHVMQSDHATEKQRAYIVRLGDAIEELSRTIGEHEADRRNEADEGSDGDVENGSSNSCSSGCMAR